MAEHLFHEGRFAVGEKFIQEAGMANGESLKRPFEAMHQVLKEVNDSLGLCSISLSSCSLSLHIPQITLAGAPSYMS